MASCELCPNEVDGDALLCADCRLNTPDVDMETRASILWGGAA